ncbi:hypothetical protein ACKWTF_015829 [Chironomus riparius]
MLFFLDIVSKVLNVKFQLDVLPDYLHLFDFHTKRKMHLTFNTVLIYKTKDPKLFTYEKNGYCALVPIPSKVPLYHLMFIMPFDGLIWILFGVSIIGSVAVWRIYRGRGAVDSHWQLAAGIFMMFIGQGADFSRRNRFVLSFLLNIICLSVFLLSNLYEGAITSFMIEPGHVNRLKTVEDLVASNHEIVSDAVFADNSINVNEFERLLPRLRIRSVDLPKNFIDEVISQRYVYILRCDSVDLLLRSRLPNGRSFTDYYYKLQEFLFWNYVELDASYLNPLIESFQYYMDLSFQAGLPHMWKVFVKQSNSQLRTNIKSEKVFLELDDFYAVFVTFFILCGFSVAVLIAEIFFQDCLSNIDQKTINLSIRNCCRLLNICNKKKQQLKVHEIVVKPCRGAV